MQCLYRHDVGTNTRPELGVRAFLQRNGATAYFIYIVVAGDKQQGATFLIDLNYLALKLAVPTYLLHEQFAIGSFLHTGKEVVATHPDRVLAVTIDHRDTTDIW